MELIINEFIHNHSLDKKNNRNEKKKLSNSLVLDKKEISDIYINISPQKSKSQEKDILNLKKNVNKNSNFVNKYDDNMNFKGTINFALEDGKNRKKIVHPSKQVNIFIII